MTGPKIVCSHNIILVTVDMAEVLGTGSLYMVSTCHTLYGQGVSVQSGQVRLGGDMRRQFQLGLRQLTHHGSPLAASYKAKL